MKKKVLSSPFFQALRILFSSTVLATAFSMLAVWIWANHFDKEVYGSFKLILSYIGLCGVICFPGFNTGVSQSAARQEFGNIKYFFKKRFVWSLFSFFILAGIALYRSPDHPLLGNALWVAAVLAPFLITANLVENFYSGCGRFKVLGFYQVLSVAIPAVVLWILPSSTSLWMLILLLKGVLLILSLAFFINIVSQLKNRVTNEATVTFAHKMSWYNVFSASIVFLQQPVADMYLGVEAVANLSIALMFAVQTKTIAGIFSTTIIPVASRAPTVRRALWNVRWKLGIATLCFGLIGVGAWFLTPWIFENHLPRYVEVIDLTRALTLCFCVGAPFTLLNAVISCQERYRFLGLINISFAGLHLALMLFFVPKYGLEGFVWARALSTLWAAVVVSSVVIRLCLRRVERPGQ